MSGIGSDTDPDADRLRLVIALGGNAILRRDENGTIEQQFSHANDAMRPMADVIGAGHEIVLTHGNGPIVGNILIRNEAARDRVPPMPLYIADADSEGGIGFMLQLALHNQLRLLGVARPVTTVITQVVVDPGDPAFAHPSKPIGPYYTRDEAARLAEAEAWTFADIPGGGMRRVVPSPLPLRIVEASAIERLAAAGDIVIAVGGGGIPVVEAADGTLRAVDAVVDKDRASALLACEMHADVLAILMEEERVYLDYRTADQRGLDALTVAEAERLLAEGVFPEGSVGPKIASCVHFVRDCGGTAIVCSAERLVEALGGRAGTRVVPE